MSEPEHGAGWRAADGLVARLEARIASGELGQGERLPAERELMEEFGLSRTVVREAIATLSNRGLLLCQPRHRPVVRGFGFEAATAAIGGALAHLLASREGVRSLYELRVLIEAGLVRHAALHADRDDVAALRRALEENRLAVEDPVRFDQTDAAFHHLFYRLAGNPALPAIHQAFVTWLFPHWLAMPRTAARNDAAFSGHREILDAVVDRDPDGAEQALRSHLRMAWDAVRVTFETS
ncbi:MAG: FCD domain-containing protein [Gluconacetobacter diazotrophicus]|nr:FCD domain-containing protein [Gluconacetobacter diazotrophicus]